MKKVILFMFTLGFILPSLTLASFDVSLRYGSKGDKVIELQDFLKDFFKIK